MKGLFFRMFAQKISIFEAKNNEMHVQNKGLRSQVALLRGTVDSLEQGLEAAQSGTQAHGSAENEARAFFQHVNYTVLEPRGSKEQGNGVPCSRQISLANLMVTRGKSLMEIPRPDTQPCIANTDTVRHPEHNSMLKPAPQFVAVKRNGSTICLNALMSQKTKQRPLFALLKSFGIPWYSYNSAPARVSRPSEPSNQLIPSNAPLAKENSTGV